tara:strand:+ start:5342 stop:5974 length:633 start_codon:yes stop_codon:yes gene_type:complete
MPVLEYFKPFNEKITALSEDESSNYGLGQGGFTHIDSATQTFHCNHPIPPDFTFNQVIAHAAGIILATCKMANDDIPISKMDKYYTAGDQVTITTGTYAGNWTIHTVVNDTVIVSGPTYSVDESGSAQYRRDGKQIFYPDIRQWGRVQIIYRATPVSNNKVTLTKVDGSTIVLENFGVGTSIPAAMAGTVIQGPFRSIFTHGTKLIAYNI